MQGLIWAAGLGTRMGDLTQNTPKPLLYCGPHRLIEYRIHAMVAGGIDRIVINVSQYADQFVEALGNGERYGCQITYSREPVGQPLGNVGGALHALPLLDDAFVVMSADAMNDYSVDALMQVVKRHPDADAVLVLGNNPDHHPSGDFALQDDLVVLDEDLPRWNYTGLAWCRRSWFADHGRATQRFGSLVKESIVAGAKVHGVHYTGHWINVDTEDRLKKAESALS